MRKFMVDHNKLNIEEFEKRIDDYFKNVTKEQLHKDLIEAGLDVYQGKEFDFIEDLYAGS